MRRAVTIHKRSRSRMRTSNNKLTNQNLTQILVIKKVKRKATKKDPPPTPKAVPPKTPRMKRRKPNLKRKLHKKLLWIMRRPKKISKPRLIAVKTSTKTHSKQRIRNISPKSKSSEQ
jgi:hypothetical protein